MLKFNFKRVFRARGIDKPFSFLVNYGYSNNSATRIVNNRIIQINMKDMEKLCVLLNCTPNDFFDWVPENPDADNGQHPLNSLKRGDQMVHLGQLINNIPIDKLADIENMIKMELNK